MLRFRTVLTALICMGLLSATAACSGSDDDASDGASPSTEDGGEGGTGSTGTTGSDGGADDEAAAVGTGDGYADADWFLGRQEEYLAHATEELEPGSVLNVIAHAERAERDPDFTWDSEAVTPEALAETLEKITGWKDTGDFDVLNLVTLLYGYRDQIPAETIEVIEEALLGFGYWFTEPTPEGVLDEKYYWSENHRIIFHASEYLVGQAYPEEIFTNDGRTGAEHRDEGRERVLAWLAEKAELGFSEWHSDVYYSLDVAPLLTLVEWAEDPEISTRAAMVLDLVHFDIALHLHEGNFGVTHGRSYMKDKSKATDQNTFALAKLLFDDTDVEYQGRGDRGATLLARAAKYRLPDVLRRVASSDEPMVDRERMSVPLDITEPVSEDPEPPYGYSFADPENVAFWWERGAQPAWQLAELTVDTVNTYDLWETPTFAAFQVLRDLAAEDFDAARELVQSLSPYLTFALLNESNTVTYRSADVMLSTVSDFRPGTYADQHHVWQATLDEEAIVFTTHPKNEPFEGEDSWPDADGYWTGSGSLPRSVQHGTAGVSMYAPQIDPEGPFGFNHLGYTHAWFPTERFDEVVRDGGWTFGRRGDGYVGLWSWRAPEWREHSPDEVFTDGLTEPFDLVAPGGSDNVWVVQVGDAEGGTFEEFQDALRAAEPTVEARPVNDAGYAGGFDVTFDSPTEGQLQVGQDGPLTVAGEEVPLRHELRYDNPWAQVEFQATTYEIGDDEGGLDLDFEAGTRSTRAG